jgi:TusA-related sulfurtransferase
MNGSLANAEASAEIILLDARGLAPPEPLVRIVAALAQLSTDGELQARTDRRPMLLYDCLHTHGCVGETFEQDDGSFVTHIRRAA